MTVSLPTQQGEVIAELGRIPAATVERIKIVDGVKMDIARLSGLVADLITRATDVGSRFAWRPQEKAG